MVQNIICTIQLNSKPNVLVFIYYSKPNVHIHIEFACRNLIGHTVGPTRAKYISLQEIRSGFESVPGIVDGSKLGGFLYQVLPHFAQISLNKCQNPDQI